MKRASVWLSLGLLLSQPIGASEPPPLAGQVSPALLKRVIDDREVVSSARISDLAAPGPQGQKKAYDYWALVRVNASLQQTHRALTDYASYARLVPFVTRSTYSSLDQTLDLEGGIFGWRLRSLLHFEEKGPRQVAFRVVAGSFTGMAGQAVFESLGEKGTLVRFSGGTTAIDFPPAFVMERGAEIVFGVTGRRMRSYIEDSRTAPVPSAGGRANDPEIPQPRHRAPRPSF